MAPVATVPARSGGTGAFLQARADEENVVPDYNYENHRFQLTDERSENYARELDGYPLDITMDRDWPGTTADPNRQRFDADAMIEVANWIDAQVKSIQSATYTPQSLAATASVSFGPSEWNAANYLKQASGSVAKTVSNYVNQLITNLQAASQSIRAAAGHNR